MPCATFSPTRRDPGSRRPDPIVALASGYSRRYETGSSSRFHNSSAVELLGGAPYDALMEAIVNIQARVQNRSGEHHVTVTTNETSQSIVIPPRASGHGSS